MAKIIPMQDRVLVRPLAVERVVNGIIIPDSSNPPQQNGEVIAVGSGKEHEPMIVKVGDRVFYNSYAGTKIEFENEELILMYQSEIMAIIEQ